MNKIKKFIRQRWAYILIYTVVIVACFLKLPYYIDAPGGLINIGDRISVDGKYESSGSINLTYVTEYQVNLPMLIMSYFIDDWTLNKINDKDERIEYEEYMIRNKLLNEEAYANATILAFTQAGLDVEIKSTDLYVSYLVDIAKTDLEVGDKLIKMDDIEIKSKKDLNEYINSLEIGTRINIIVENNKKEYKRYAEIIEYEGYKIIGIVPVEIHKFKTDPEITISTDASEYGPSGGLMISLAVYDAITKEDITGGLTIVGTGTIDLEGNVGSIGGVEYKIKGAVKKGADVFFVPVGENYDEAKKIVEQENYDIELVPIATFDEALNYLRENVM